jgi:tetratricopeptide (TPR) repeat protein
MGEQLGDIVVLSAALGALDTVFGSRGYYRERLQIAQRQLALSRDARFVDTRKRISLLCQTGNAHLFVGEYEQALPHLVEAEHLADQIQDINQQVYALGLQAQVFFGLDQWEEMLEIDAKRQVLVDRYGRDRVDRMCFYCGLGANIHALRGEFDQSRACREEAYNMMGPNKGPSNDWGLNELWPYGQHY